MTVAFTVWDQPPTVAPLAWWRRWAHEQAAGHSPVPEAAVVISPYVVHMSYRAAFNVYFPVAEAIVDGLAAGGIIDRTEVAAVIVKRAREARRDGLRVNVVPAARVRIPR